MFRHDSRKESRTWKANFLFQSFSIGPKSNARGNASVNSEERCVDPGHKLNAWNELADKLLIIGEEHVGSCFGSAG